MPLLTKNTYGNFVWIKSTFVFWLIFLLADINALSQAPNEYQVKAVFIYNFAHFVQWPSSAFQESQSPFVIGILGRNVFDSSLKETIAGEKINGHPILIKYFQDQEDVKDCHILFITKSYSSSITAITQHLKSKYTLTVSDADNFTKEEGMIRFFIEGNKVRVEINIAAVKAAELEVSSKLLRVAEIYNP